VSKQTFNQAGGMQASPYTQTTDKIVTFPLGTCTEIDWQPCPEEVG